MVTVVFVTVIHAVKHIVTTPAPGDTVSTIQTQKLILSALLHTANLSTKTQLRKNKNLLTDKLGAIWMKMPSCTIYCCLFELWKAALTSSEPSRQLSCPSQRRLADTHPPLAHTYSFTEQEGTTGKENVKNHMWPFPFLVLQTSERLLPDVLLT